MKIQTKRVIALAGVLALGLGAAKAQSDGALLDALVKKGVLSDQEAEDVRASEAKDYAQTPAGKLSISDHVTNLKLYGDARFRYEYIDENVQNHNNYGGTAGGPNETINRSRFRLRIGADYTFTDNFKAGFELETSTAADSANQTFGTEFGKDTIAIGLMYLQWKPVDWAVLTGGKQRNPLYTTDLVWDADINPEGGSEVLTFNPTDNLSVGFTAAQFDYAENANTNTDFAGTQNLNSNSVWMFVEQVPVQFNFNKDTYIKIVPGFYSYMGNGNSPVPNNPAANNAAASPGIVAGGYTAGISGGVGNGSSVGFGSPYATENLAIFTAPGEVDWKVGSLPMRAYWDFALNTQGNARVQNTYLGNGQNLAINTAAAPGNNAAANAAAALADQNANRNLTDNVAWLAGVQVGQNKKKGDWSVKGDFRQIGLGSVDPNINDSDFNESYLNTQGFRIQSIYNFTDFLTGSVTFYDAWAYKSNLMNGSPGQNPSVVPLGGANAVVTGTSSGATNNLVGVHGSQRVQIDLLWKF